MIRVLFAILGVALIVIGALSLVGAVEVLRAGNTTEVIAQSFLVPISLFVVGVFAIWGAWTQGRR